MRRKPHRPDTCAVRHYSPRSGASGSAVCSFGSAGERGEPSVYRPHPATDKIAVSPLDLLPLRMENSIFIQPAICMCAEEIALRLDQICGQSL